MLLHHCLPSRHGLWRDEMIRWARWVIDGSTKAKVNRTSKRDWSKKMVTSILLKTGK